MHRRSPTVLAALMLVAAGLTILPGPAAVAVSPGRTEAVSIGAAGTDPSGPASSPAVSADGSQVAFESRAVLDPVVQPSASAPYNVYVRDRRSPGRTVLISRGLPMTYLGGGYSVPLRTAAAPEAGGDGDSVHPSISATGRYVAFESIAANLRDDFGRAVRRIVICDRDPDDDGIFDELRPDGLMDYGYVSLTSSPEATGTDPSLSADGTMIAWREQLPSSTRIVATRLVHDPQGRPLPPDPTAVLRPETENSVGPPQLSADGRQIVFAMGSCTAFAGCQDPMGSIQSYDVATDRLSRVDYLPGGGFAGTAQHPAVSASGQTIAYDYFDPGGFRATVVVTRGTAEIASRNVSGQPADGTMPTLSGDGRYIAFESSADGMHADAQGTGRRAIVLRDLVLDARRAGLPRLPGELGSPAASPCSGQVCPAAGPASSPRLSANGSVLVFTSASDDLVTPACCVGAVFARIFQPRVAATATVFGSTEVGGSASRTITLQHTGFGPVAVGSVVVEGDPAFVLGTTGNCAGATLHAEETCSLSVDFKPDSAGTKQGVVRISQTDGTTVDVPLRGDAEPPRTSPTPPPPGTTPPPPPPPAPSGELVVTPNPVDFGGGHPALVPAGTQTVAIRNAATVPITITSIAILSGPHFVPGDFTVTATTCRQLAPAATCTATLTATPQLPGVRSGVLAVTAAETTYTKLVPLSSRALEPVLSVNPAVVRANRVTTVTGQSLPPDRPVTLTVPGTGLHAASKTDPAGRFSAPLLVFPQTSAGTWPVIATVDGTAIRAQGTVLVEPGSFQPPDFTSRR